VRGEEKKKLPQNKPWMREGKNRVNRSSPSWLAHKQGVTKKVHPSVHHPSTLVHWWVLVHPDPVFWFNLLGILLIIAKRAAQINKI
jgi:hypothetical protein